ncbi:hypothetical protein ABZ215_25035 [Amycolatopsis sp. NPDC006131]|uniref:hypothetical protein n=1 Tax=Amycolatopsis sp. NPDC006131 TaxID=3156731 RepID=UPI0033ADA787
MTVREFVMALSCLTIAGAVFLIAYVSISLGIAVGVIGVVGVLVALLIERWSW